MVWLTILVILGLLLVLVLAHELGHFATAKWFGCGVEEFGFGFPPRLVAWKRGGTVYSLNLLPIGGFVKIKGEDMAEEKPGPNSFGNKLAYQRVIILAAGVFMNVVAAFVLLTVQAVVGVPTLITDQNAPATSSQQTYVLEVSPGSPADQAGVKSLDRIVSIAGVNTPGIAQIQEISQENAGKSVALVLDRSGQEIPVSLEPRVNPPENEGSMGIALAATGLVKKTWWQAPWAGLQRTWDITRLTAEQFTIITGRLFHGQSVGADVSGPVGIAIYANEATKMGLSYVLEFAALISLNLAIINILPFPALDGSRILFVLVEKMRGRKIAGRTEQITHTVGFALLLLLMVLITFKDIRKFF
ncbi:MAG: RIP metalloprotease RseP [Candidatus Andersenbacteria bacterium]|nr:RIP metalloprotease RseP [bacterium]MDZ4225779.1 RIP metalloprotease RseP [Candidatus Andersenbacteria bacterium]